MKMLKLQEKRRLIIRLAWYAITFAIVAGISIYFSDPLKAWLPTLGAWGPIVFILYFVLSHVVAPISGLAILLLAYDLFGVVDTLIYVAVASIISAAISFWISRRFGRPVVKKLVGEDSMKEIDQITDQFGVLFLVVARTIGYHMYELVSYAAGFTRISFGIYMLITAFGIVLTSVIFGYFLKDAPIAIVYTVFLVFMSISFIVGYFMVRKVRRNLRENLGTPRTGNSVKSKTKRKRLSP